MIGKGGVMTKDYKQIRELAKQSLSTLEQLDKIVKLEEYGMSLQDELYELSEAGPLDELA